MSFHRSAGRLWVEGVALSEIADRFGTPCYVYSRARLTENWRAYDDAFGARAHRIHYSVKANGSLALLNILHSLGSGFDIVSGGELARALAAGANGSDIIFSGVGKSRQELIDAVTVGVACINVESEAELDRLTEIAAALGRRAPIALRVNPDVDPQTHPYISTGLQGNKFGVSMVEALRLYRKALAVPSLEVRGIACHIGSQMTSLAPISDTVGLIVDLAKALEREGCQLSHLDLGGGLGIRYRDEQPPAITDYVRVLCDVPERFEIHVEPGRSIIGDAGVLLTSIEYLKAMPTKHFAICDAAMTELLRPALYNAWHALELLEPPTADVSSRRYDLVGPVCESADFLAQDRELCLSPGARLAVMNAGAYGFVMASSYNARPRPAEILVDGHSVTEIRPRETIGDLMASERLATARELP
ncbi:MAG: diaminopimelate decarboxylase [Gammaproteobacteria bacterium]|nr:diaminopimelate decarboxylase [Gammaproteobacteria bacterium]